MKKPILSDFDAFEVHGCKEFQAPSGYTFTEQVDDQEATFWSVYGHYAPDTGQHGVECLCDFNTRKEAEDHANGLTRLLPQKEGAA